MKWLVLAFAAVVGLTGCAPVVRYQPKAIVPAETAARLESRSLNDPGLKEFMEKNHKLTRWPVTTWDLNDLALAAYYFNPQMEVARAQVEAAQAAIITARARPNPTVSVAPGIPSPYLLGLDLLFIRQTAGKRRIMVEEARTLSTAAEYGLASTAWKLRSGLRTAYLNYFMSLRQYEILASETRLHSQQVQWLGERFKVGEIARPEVASAQLGLLNSHIALRAAEGRVAETQAALAAAIGIPVSALEGIKFSWTVFDHPPEAATLSPQHIRREAVLNRLDVRQSLAQYEAAQDALQLEVARQHPDFSLGPGYHFEERDNFFTLTFSTLLPVFNRNQGPIAEAEARRKEAAAQFLATQANAIAQSEQALAGYRAALRELQEARKSLAQIRDVQEAMALQQIKFGQSDHLFLNSIRLQGAAAVSTQLTALEHVQAALGQLEDAVQRPLEPGELPPPVSDSEKQREEKQ